MFFLQDFTVSFDHIWSMWIPKFLRIEIHSFWVRKSWISARTWGVMASNVMCVAMCGWPWLICLQ
jgi:hypothetical protein